MVVFIGAAAGTAAVASKTTAATVSAIATGAAIAGTAVQAVGAISQARVSKKQASAQAAVQEQQATRERAQAKSDEADFRRRQALAAGTRRAGLGASGARQGVGSPLLAEEDFASEIELQALRIRSGGDVRATRLEQQAGLTRSSGRAAQTAGFFRAGSSLLSGAGKVFA